MYCGSEARTDTIEPAFAFCEEICLFRRSGGGLGVSEFDEKPTIGAWGNGAVEREGVLRPSAAPHRHLFPSAAYR